MLDETLTIDGRQVATAESDAVVDPATEEPFARTGRAESAHLDLAMGAAAKAFPAWSKLGSARGELLHAMAGVLTDSTDELAHLLTREQGKPLVDARREVEMSAVWLRYYADLSLEPQLMRESAQSLVLQHRKPLGVVSAITPWNYPVLQGFWKIAPALAAGNTMVLKPSPHTPLATLAIGRLMADVLPPGVLNILSGDDDLGRAMVAHRVPRKISFTGSVAAGCDVAATAGSTLKRVTLELGGNDAAVLLPDVDIDAHADAFFANSFRNCGQVCLCVKRIYVHESRHDELVDALADRARSARVGSGLDPSTQIGPLTTALQRERIEGLVEGARERGGRIVAGGKRIDGPGYFFEPTIVTDVTDDVPLVAEEQFGPALPILAYRDVDDAVRRANDSPFGLGASVWGTDLSAAAAVAERLEAGTIWVNAHRVLSVDLPMGGHKLSGLGVEHGIDGFHEFTDASILHIAR